MTSHRFSPNRRRLHSDFVAAPGLASVPAMEAADLSVWAGEQITRRRLFKRAGFLAAATAASTAVGTFGSRFILPAGAVGSGCSPCGPSPICTGANECDATHGDFNTYCNDANQNYKRGPYSLGGPGCYAGTASVCWDENRCGCTNTSIKGIWKCCDCCSSINYGGGACSGACTKYKCICRQRISTAC